MRGLDHAIPEPFSDHKAPQASIIGKSEARELLVEMKGITKRFPGVMANDHVDFDLRVCEVHALLGENGSGKTTLMKILFGLFQPDEGEIRIRGQRVVFRSPRDAINHGIGMVHQHFTLIPTMSVAENIVLGLRSGREPLLDLDRVERRTAELSEAYDLPVDPRVRVEQLSVGEKQRVEVIKALYRGARILILDEPTSVLTPQEAEALFRTLRSMVAEGLTIVFITHKLPEVMAISDRVTVLRRGRVTARLQTRQTNPAELSEKMVGREVLFTVRRHELEKQGLVLAVNDLWAMGDKGLPTLKGITFSVQRGEILGLAGVAGNGQRELAEVLAGMRHATQGKVIMLGRDMTNHSPREIIEHGVGSVPEDRLGMGVIMDFSVAENLVLEVHSEPPISHRWFLPYGRNLFLDRREIQARAQRLAEEYDIVTPSVGAPARTLSGGNLQRLILARVLSREPRLLVAAQPTSGLDVGATEFIWRKLLEQKGKGVAILLISEDLNEVMSLSDRIAVVYDGVIAGTLNAREADVREIGLLMSGAKRHG